MPNIVTSRCTVTGPLETIARFRVECIRRQGVDAGQVGLDFEAVLPSPEILHGSLESSNVSDGLAVLGVTLPGGNPFSAETLEGMLAYPWVRQAGITTTEALKAALLARDPGCAAAAEAAINRVRATGYRSLNAWRGAHWGVNYNAFDYQEISNTPFSFRFCTPWSFPLPVFQELAARYPALTFECVCICGSEFGGEGVFNPRPGQQPFTLLDATERLYIEVHGAPPEEEV